MDARELFAVSLTINHLNLDVQSFRNRNTHDQLQSAVVNAHVNQALVDAGLIALPGGCAIAAGALSGSNLETLGGQGNGASHVHARPGGDILDGAADLIDLVNVNARQLDSRLLHGPTSSRDRCTCRQRPWPRSPGWQSVPCAGSPSAFRYRAAAPALASRLRRRRS